MRSHLPSISALVLSACAASDPPRAAPLPTIASSAPTVASIAPTPSASSSSVAPAPIASVDAAPSSSAVVPAAPHDPPNAKTPEDPPIPKTLLAGTVDGRRFVLASALVVKDPAAPDGRILWMFDRPVTCGAQRPPPNARSVSVEVPWPMPQGFGAAGKAAGGVPIYSMGGRLIDMSTTPVPRVRFLLRFHSDTIDVAGEVRATICP